MVLSDARFTVMIISCFCGTIYTRKASIHYKWFV